MCENQELLADRLPIPRYIVCDQGGSQARFLLSKLNPSSTHMSGGYGGASQGQIILTDDVSLGIFIVSWSGREFRGGRQSYDC